MWMKRRTTLATDYLRLVILVVQLMFNDSIEQLMSAKNITIHWDMLNNKEISWTLTNIIDQSCNRKPMMMLRQNDSYCVILHWMCVRDQTCWTFNGQNTALWKTKVIWKAFIKNWITCCTYVHIHTKHLAKDMNETVNNQVSKETGLLCQHMAHTDVLHKSTDICRWLQHKYETNIIFSGSK
jgi:hypothetical protein